jgi:hypothetical protein
MLSETVKRELEAERESVLALKKMLEAKLDALDKILAPTDPLELFGRQLKLSIPPAGNGSSSRQTGMRAYIKTALDANPLGLKSHEVASKVEGMGYLPKGKGSVKSLVYGELSRMTRKGILKRNGNKYFLPTVS